MLIFRTIKWFFIFSLLCGCSNSEIQGIVKDPFGNSLPDVQVNIENTDMKASTDRDGRYSIPYILGTFKVSYAKSGYTTQKLSLTLQEKTRYPAQPIVLYPIPPESGLYYVGEKNLVKLTALKIVIQENKSKDHRSIIEKSTVSFYPAKLLEQVVLSGKAQFIDKFSTKLLPMQLNANGVFLQLATKGFGVDLEVIYDGSLQEEQTEIGQEKLLVRSLNLKPGAYAWVEFKQNELLGRPLPQDNSLCFPFKVKSKDQSQSTGVDNVARAVDAKSQEIAVFEATKNMLKAIEERNEQLAAELLNRGADPNGAKDLRNPLVLSVRYNLPNLVRVLLEKGANPNLIVEGEDPLLISAAKDGNVNLVSLLLDKGANPNAISKLEGWTALMCAADRGNNQLLKILLAKGGNPNLRDRQGNTALMLVAPKGWIETVVILLDAGIDVTIRDQNGFDAATLASRESHFNISDLIKLRQSKPGGANKSPQDLRRQVEKISEKIRAAHLKKDINKWFSCYTSSYPNLSNVKNKTLELWKNYDIKEVNYRISNVQRVSDNEASADIVWNIQLYDHRTHDYTLVRQSYKIILENGPGGLKIRDSKEIAGG